MLLPPARPPHEQCKEQETSMDSYMWYTDTIHRDAQARLHARRQAAAQGRLQHLLQPRRARWQQRVLLIIGERLIALGLWLTPHASSPMGRR